MKKTLFALIAVLVAISNINAQTIVKPAIGLNFTKLSDDPLSREQTGRLGWQLGGTVTLGGEFYLEPGIFWMKNNWKLQEVGISEEKKMNNDISSIRIPIFAGWNVVGSPDDNRNFHIFGGPAAMIVTKTNTETTGLKTDDFNKFIFGFNLGAGVSLGKLFIDVGYEWGLNDIYKDDDEHAKSRNLWINAGFRLTFL